MEQPLWRVSTHGHQRVPAGRAYWYDNHERKPRDNVVFQMSLAGTILYRDATGEREVPAGFGVLFIHGERSAYGLPPERSPHQQHGYENRWVSMMGAGLVEHVNHLRQRFGSIMDLRNDATIEREMVELGGLLNRTTPASATFIAAAVHGFVMRLFDRAERAHAADQSPAAQAVEYLLRQPTLASSLKQVASQFGCSREHLSRLFHQRVGTTPANHLASARLDHALRLLRDTDLPVAAIAEQSGYLSVHTFRRQVLRATRKTPTAVRGTRSRG